MSEEELNNDIKKLEAIKSSLEKDIQTAQTTLTSLTPGSSGFAILTLILVIPLLFKN